MKRPLVVAAAQPPCTPAIPSANARAHADAIRAAQARVVVFPELSLTGYALDAEPVDPRDEVLAPIVEACAETGTIAFVGAPVAGDGARTFVGMLQLDGDGVEVAYRKTFLGEDETARFAAGEGAVAVEVDGWRIGLGICKDTGVDQHVADTAALGVDLYLAGLVHRPDELAEQERRGVRIARACNAYVAFASCAGATGPDYPETAGVSTVWAPDGTALARAGAGPGELAVATIR